MSSIMEKVGESESNSIQSTWNELHTVPEYGQHEHKVNETTAATKENKDGSDSEVCFICSEKDMLVPQLECKTCQNIRIYHSKRSQSKLKADASNDSEDDHVNVTFPGPGVVKRSHIYGNYVVASRTIEKGELIILERPITIGPYSPPDVLPLCLSCCKDIGLSSKCSKCKWPVCGEECEQFYLHSENECEIFAKNGVRTKEELKEYFSVETLRALLLRDRDASAWEWILGFEPHSEIRANDYRAKENTDFIIHFIRDKCNLGEKFSPEEIEHVVGVLSINAFWASKDLNRYASCLFNKITLFAHDCDPNTNRKLFYLSHDSDGEKGAEDERTIISENISDVALQVRAAWRIEEGEMITTRYINIDQPVLQRREELRETFYFECTCSRCLCELSELENNNFIEINLANTRF